MKKREFDVENAPDTSGLSVRQARRVRHQWEQEVLKAAERAVDPEAFFQTSLAASPLIRLLCRRDWWFDSREVAAVMGMGSANNLQHPSAVSRLGLLGSKYTRKLGRYESPTGGVMRVYSKPAVVMILMTSLLPRARAFQAWIGHVVAHASEHPDFVGFWDMDLDVIDPNVEGVDLWGEALAKLGAKRG